MTYREKFCDLISQIQCSNHAGTIEYEEAIENVVCLLQEIKGNRSVAYFIGNGGSAAIAMHMTVDFLKNGGLITHSMHDAPTITCLGNDFGYEHIFSKQLEQIVKTGDVLFAISSSGASPNILNAVSVAKAKGCHTIVLSGFQPDNPLRMAGEYSFFVPCEEYGIVESIHNMILQQIVDELKEMKLE